MGNDICNDIFKKVPIMPHTRTLLHTLKQEQHQQHKRDKGPRRENEAAPAEGKASDAVAVVVVVVVVAPCCSLLEPSRANQQASKQLTPTPHHTTCCCCSCCSLTV